MVASAALLRSSHRSTPSRSLPEQTASRDTPGQIAARRNAIHDAELVRRFNAGEDSAFVEITDRHRPRLFAIGYAMLKNHSDAEEIAQDALVRAHRGLSQFRGDSSLATWLHRIALNLARNRYWHYHRRQQHMTTSLEGPVRDGIPGTVADLLASDTEGPAREAETAEFLALVATCISRLEERPREILALLNQTNLSYREIALELDIGLGTVKSRIARARKNLQKHLQNTCTEFGPRAALSDWFEPRRTVSVSR